MNLLRSLKTAGILGMNCRNTELIMRCNPRQFFPLVDNKIITKKLAGHYKVPIPELYYTIESHTDLRGLESALKDKMSFVVKPARGAGGSGIILIQEHKDEHFITQSGKILTKEDLFHHISNILSGIFSLEAQEDAAIIEALIHPDDLFASVTFQGVPDIRIIVYRGIPIMAMVRLPTKASDGKANLHRGAVGAGIDISSGITMTAVHKAKVITNHPDTGNPVNGIKVSHWETMLNMAAHSFEMTGLSYLGVDLIIDRDSGPLLLELNARPGLAIQIANRKGLKIGISLVDNAPKTIFATPESRVQWAHTHIS